MYLKVRKCFGLSWAASETNLRSCVLLSPFFAAVPSCIGFMWQDFVRGGYRGDFCEKVLENSPVSNTGNASWLRG